MENKLIDSELLKKLETLKLNSNIVLNKGYDGSRKSKSKGTSVEFSDFREYVPGDDFRKVDWNAYGRFGKLFIKLFTEEREAQVNIFIDNSKSMAFGNPKKSYIGKQLTLILGYVALSNLDRVNIYTQYDNTLKETGFLCGKKSLPSIAEHLDLLNFNETTNLLKLIRRKPYKRGISIIISDFFADDFEETTRYLSYFNQSVIAIQVLCKEELEPQYMGDIRFIDSETEEGKDISITPAILNSYKETLKGFISNISEAIKRCGGFYTLVSNETPIEEIVFRSFVKAGILR